jgi:hypothetical protein
MGCGSIFPREDLACMRNNVSVGAIVTFYEKYPLEANNPTLKFTTIVDSITKFNNCTERAIAGNFSKLVSWIQAVDFITPFHKIAGYSQNQWE